MQPKFPISQRIFTSILQKNIILTILFSFLGSTTQFSEFQYNISTVSLLNFTKLKNFLEQYPIIKNYAT